MLYALADVRMGKGQPLKPYWGMMPEKWEPPLKAQFGKEGPVELSSNLVALCPGDRQGPEGIGQRGPNHAVEALPSEAFLVEPAISNILCLCVCLFFEHCYLCCHVTVEGLHHSDYPDCFGRVFPFDSLQLPLRVTYIQDVQKA